MPIATDQNLQFGVLALQAGFLDVAQFGDACSAWATRIDGVLADLLVQRGWLTTDDRVEVERLVERKLRKKDSQVIADESAHQLSGSSRLGPSSRRQTTSTPPPAWGATTPYIAPLPASGYERSNLHATGGMGQIWQAHDHNLDREVAIKDLRPELADDPQIRERFVREARLMGQLAHPGIVPIHLVGEDEHGTPYYVMKFVHGRTLEQAITAYHQQPTPSAFRDLLRHFGDVCQTIGFARTQGVIHRDLKPRNILLGDFGETLVLDWGLAKRLEPGGSTHSVLGTPTADQGLTQAGQILGTPAYISPEQTNGHPAGPLTDIYALGVILYEILVGRCPYEGTDTLEVLLQVRNPNPFRWSGFTSLQAAGFSNRRPLDSFGVGFFYTGLSNDFTDLANPLIDLQDPYGCELYYNFGVTPWFNLTTDLQLVNPAEVDNDTAVVLGLRGSLRL